MATMMVLQYVNTIGSKEQNMATIMVLQYVNNIGSKEQNMATMIILNMSIILAVRNRKWQQ